MSAGKLSIKDSRTGRNYEIDIQHNAIKASDISQIKVPVQITKVADAAAGGLRIFDPALENTAVKHSRLTFLDAYNGRLFYRDRDIRDVIKGSSFENEAYLMLFGSHPSASGREQFQRAVAEAAGRPAPEIQQAVCALPSSAPMHTLVATALTASLALKSDTIPAYVGRDLYRNDIQEVDRAIIRTYAALLNATAMAFCHKHGEIFQEPDSSQGFVWNLLFSMNLVDQTTQQPRERDVALLSKLFVLYIDHEMSNATAAFLLAASSRSDPLSCLISAYTACYGLTHGGALDVVYRQLKKLNETQSVSDFLRDVKENKAMLFGFGHRVYKAKDPRAALFRQILQEAKGDVKDPILETALELDRLTCEDEWFTSRNWFINGDLFAYFTYTSLGFPQDMVFPFTMFARAIGWLAHWREFLMDLPRIWRPKAIYLGNIPEQRPSKL